MEYEEDTAENQNAGSKSEKEKREMYREMKREV